MTEESPHFLLDMAIGVTGTIVAAVSESYFVANAAGISTIIFALARGAQALQSMWYAYQDRKIHRKVPPPDKDYEPY